MKTEGAERGLWMVLLGEEDGLKFLHQASEDSQRRTLLEELRTAGLAKDHLSQYRFAERFQKILPPEMLERRIVAAQGRWLADYDLGFSAGINSSGGYRLSRRVLVFGYCYSLLHLVSSTRARQWMTARRMYTDAHIGLTRSPFMRRNHHWALLRGEECAHSFTSMALQDGPNSARAKRVEKLREAAHWPGDWRAKWVEALSGDFSELGNKSVSTMRIFAAQVSHHDLDEGLIADFDFGFANALRWPGRRTNLLVVLGPWEWAKCRVLGFWRRHKLFPFDTYRS